MAYGPWSAELGDPAVNIKMLCGLWAPGRWAAFFFFSFFFINTLLLKKYGL